MPQLSLYLDETEMASLRTHAANEGVSLSSYARGVLNKNNETNAWSDAFLNVFGAASDDTFKVPSELDWHLDAKRLEF